MTARSAALGVLSLSFLAILMTLGTWQIHRLAWKKDLIARVDARVHATPVAPPGPTEWSHFTASVEEYRHVSVNGVFLNEQETLVQAVTVFGAGFWVLTPLQTKDGFRILVNRGFVPSDLREPAARLSGQIAGPTTVTGLLRLTEPYGAFLQVNDPASEQWHSRDVAAISAARRISPAAPYFIDADARPNPGGVPVGGLTVVAFVNNHLAYALTWFTLAAMLAAATVAILLRGRIRRGDLS